MTSGRYAQALGPTLAWLAIEHRGWGAVVAPASEQREIAEELARQLPARPVIELGAGADADWFGAAQAAGGGFVHVARALDDKARERLMTMLNQQRDLTSDRGVWTLVVSARELAALRRHAPDLASVLRSIETVPFIPRTLSDEELVAARAELHEYYQRRFGRLDLRGFIRSEHEDVSFPVEAIYQPLKAVVDEAEALEVEPDETDPSDMPPVVLQVGGQAKPLTERLATNISRPALIVGAPGSGKSFFLRWCALEGSRAASLLGVERPIPLYVPLAALRAATDPPVLASHVVDLLLEAGLTIAHAVACPVDAARVVYLLDGLDEVGDIAEAVVAQIADLAAAQSRARVIVTSRPAGLERLRFEAQRLFLEGLDSAALRALLVAWCGLYEVQRAGAHALARGRAEGERLAGEVLTSPALAELARSPLLATIIAIVHRAGVRLPDHRVELYDHVVRILVERWNELRSQDVDAPRAAIRVPDAIRLLGPVALQMIESGHDGAIAEASLREHVARQLARGTVRVVATADDAIHVFRDSLGLIVEQAPGVYAFLHKTLAEYLAAHEVVRTGALEQRVIAEHCFESAWREVVLLALGIVGTLQANDARLLAAVSTIVDRARAARDFVVSSDDAADIATLLAAILADDPGVASELAQLVIDELVPAWWLDRAFASEAETLLLERSLQGTWGQTLGRRLRSHYRNGLPAVVLERDQGMLSFGLVMSAEEIGLPFELFFCEWLTANLVSDKTRGAMISFRSETADDIAATLRGLNETGLLRRSSVINSPVEPPRETFYLPTTKGERLALVSGLLAAWRALAAKHTDGPQPPASVEEAIAKYGPPADAVKTA